MPGAGHLEQISPGVGSTGRREREWRSRRSKQMEEVDWVTRYFIYSGVGVHHRSTSAQSGGNEAGWKILRVSTAT